jgi:hypothetical protein
VSAERLHASSHSVQSLRRNVEMVIERLMDSEGRGLKCETISLDTRWVSLDYSN